ncbi:MAG: DUF547 domain-containing protein, partial [Planctomycetota bacterium]|nr:DUF547 domain-containing protein [Planctomycetota bacterium]
MLQTKRSTWLARAALGLALGLAIAVSLAGFASLEWLRDWHAQMLSAYASAAVVTAAVFVAVYIVLAALSIPIASLLTLLGGAVFGVPLGLLLSTLGATLGATGACTLARYGLRDWAERRLGDRWDSLNERMERDGAWYLLSLRLVPVAPFWVVNLAMGLTRIKLSTFVWVSWLGMLPGGLLYVVAGAELPRLRSLSDLLDPALLAILAVLGLLPLLLRLATRRGLARRWRFSAGFGAALLLLGVPVLAISRPAPAPRVPPVEIAAADHHDARDHLNATLKRFVDQHGMVDYAGLQANPQDLDMWYAWLARLEHSEYTSWSRDAQLAFWINTYNGLTLLAIRQHYPIPPSAFGLAQMATGADIPSGSIRHIPWLWHRVAFTVMQEPHTLDQIEHQIIRPEFQEPRIHMAINCASVGCPPLRNEAFAADKLETQLQDQTERFLRQHPATQVTIDRAQGTVTLSAILSWFADDFAHTEVAPSNFASASSASERGVLAFIAPYLDDADASYLRTGDYTVRYRNYDWSLNQRGASPSRSPRALAALDPQPDRPCMAAPLYAGSDLGARRPNGRCPP